MRLTVSGWFVLAIIATVFICAWLGLLTWICATRPVQVPVEPTRDCSAPNPVAESQVQAIPAIPVRSKYGLLPPPPAWVNVR